MAHMSLSLFSYLAIVFFAFRHTLLLQGRESNTIFAFDTWSIEFTLPDNFSCSLPQVISILSL